MSCEEGTRPQINLFPNLSETQLAATIYWPEFLQAIPYRNAGNDVQIPITEKYLRKIANKYNLWLVPEFNLKDDEADDRRVYTIVSHSNQPFAWLKVGHFIQDLSEYSSHSQRDMNITFEILPAALPEGTSSERKGSYEQIRMSISSTWKNVD
jgi:hypothetical protein